MVGLNRPELPPGAPQAPTDHWESYSPSQHALLLSDLATGIGLHLDRSQLHGYSRNMERRLYRRAADLAAILQQSVPARARAATHPWQWAQLTRTQQAERLQQIVAWARYSWRIPAYDPRTRRLCRELAAAATVVADRMSDRSLAGDRSAWDGR